MGSCFSCCYKTTAIPDTKYSYKTAIKSPNGITYRYYSSKKEKKGLKEGTNINDWIQKIYKKSEWTDYIVYNDQTEKIGIHQHSCHGHCKGILTWNTKTSRVAWLIHSVPNFPRTFNLDPDGVTISELEHGEYIYGQSFVYVEMEYTPVMLNDILQQLYHMSPHIYLSNNIEKIIFDSKRLLKEKNCTKLLLNENIFHVAKSSLYHIDIYEDYLVPEFGGPCQVESWMRGQQMKETPMVTHIKEMMGTNSKSYTESHDHSKIAISSNKESHWVFIGDLNRMESQKNRGGGGIIIINKELWLVYRSMIVE